LTDSNYRAAVAVIIKASTANYTPNPPLKTMANPPPITISKPPVKTVRISTCYGQESKGFGANAPNPFEYA
jgi:hypothetical protein